MRTSTITMPRVSKSFDASTPKKTINKKTKEKKTKKSKTPKTKATKAKKAATPAAKKLNFEKNIWDLFKSIAPEELKIQKGAIFALNAILVDHMTRLNARSVEFAKQDKKVTLKGKYVDGAVALIYPGQLGKTISTTLNAAMAVATENKHGATKFIDVVKVGRFMANERPQDFRVGGLAAVAMAATLESLMTAFIGEILASGHDDKMITLRDTTTTIRSDANLAKIMGGLIFVTDENYRTKRG